MSSHNVFKSLKSLEGNLHVARLYGIYLCLTTEKGSICQLGSKSRSKSETVVSAIEYRSR